MKMLEQLTDVLSNRAIAATNREHGWKCAIQLIHLSQKLLAAQSRKPLVATSRI